MKVGIRIGRVLLLAASLGFFLATPAKAAAVPGCNEQDEFFCGEALAEAAQHCGGDIESFDCDPYAEVCMATWTCKN